MDSSFDFRLSAASILVSASQLSQKTKRIPRTLFFEKLNRFLAKIKQLSRVHSHFVTNILVYKFSVNPNAAGNAFYRRSREQLGIQTEFELPYTNS